MGALQDPKLELHDATDALLDSNNNWQDSLDAGEIIASTTAPTDPQEVAIVARLAPGNYTSIVSGANNTTGIELVESYILDTSGSHGANISTRGHVGFGDEALIGGFIVGGNTSKTILVRALGPSLAASAGGSVLVDPQVELYDGDGQVIASNDNWNSGSQVSEIIATGIPPEVPLESALIATVAPGDYTAVVSGLTAAQALGW
jgi:hypothetical protein